MAGGIVGYNSERGPSKDHFTIVWAHLTQQFQRRSFASDFLSNFLFLVTVAILVGGRVVTNWPSSFRGDNFKLFFAKFSIFSNGGYLGWWPGSSDTILKEDHLKTIPPKFGSNWPSGFRGVDQNAKR